jgi:hypothetical protein
MRYRVAAMIRTLASYDFTVDSPDFAFLGAGWGVAADRGSPLMAQTGDIVLPPPPASGLALEIVLDPQMQPGVPRAQRCTVAVNGDVLATKTIRGPFRFTVSVEEWNRTVLRVSISVQDGQGHNPCTNTPDRPAAAIRAVHRNTVWLE